MSGEDSCEGRVKSTTRTNESNILLSQSGHFKHTSQDSVNKLIIQLKMSPLVVPSNSVTFNIPTCVKNSEYFKRNSEPLYLNRFITILKA